MSDLRKDIGERIRSERQALQWTQYQLSQECGVTQPRLSEIEAGKKEMYLSTAVKISDALSVPLDWMVKGD